MRERTSHDKVHLLMEETGCDPGEAELALASVGYDVEKAVRAIAGQLRHIVALKLKFQAPSRSLYGLVVAVGDTRRSQLLRLRAVVSYNPTLFETDLAGDWYDVEKALYAFRLGEGALQHVSQDLERLMSDRWGLADAARFHAWLRDSHIDRLKENAERLVSACFSGAPAQALLDREELNLDQYRRVRREDPPAAAAPAAGAAEGLELKVSLEEDAGGVPARDVRPGDTVRALLTDERDIAQYVSKLLGGRVGEGVKPLPASVEDVAEEGGSLLFRLRLSGSIVGVSAVPPQTPLHVDRRPDETWWRKLNPFRR